MTSTHCRPRVSGPSLWLAIAAFITVSGPMSHANPGGAAASAPGGSDWQLVVGEGRGIPAGFDRDGWAVTAAQEWNGAVYLGVSAHPSYGCQIWRTADGVTFTQVAPDGFGNSDNTEVPAMAVFGVHLYAGTSNHDYAGGDSGARLWRTPDGVTWELVSSPGFGDRYTGHLRSLAVFDGALYVGLGKRNAAPPLYEYSVEIWRSTTGHAGTWELVYEEGTSVTQRYVAEALVVFDDQLYCVFADPESFQYPKLRRTSDGTSWEEIPDFDLQCGFGFGDTATAAVLGEDLYVASVTNLGGGPICRSRDGVTWGPLDGPVTELAVFRGTLYAGRPTGGVMRTTDGLAWERLGPEEINGPVSALGELRGALLVGSMNLHQGCEVWRLRTPIPVWVQPVTMATE